MSLATWKKEFYPIPVSKVSKKNALQHSLQKWIGRRKVNLKKHGMCIDKDDPVRILEINLSAKDITTWQKEFIFGDDTCALCAYYPCLTCPIALATSGDVVACNSMDSVYYKSLDSSPEPMIRLIKKAIKLKG